MHTRSRDDQICSHFTTYELKQQTKTEQNSTACFALFKCWGVCFVLPNLNYVTVRILHSFSSPSYGAVPSSHHALDFERLCVRVYFKPVLLFG